MSDTDNLAEQPPKITGLEGYTAANVQASRDLVNEMMVVYRAYLADISDTTDKNFRANEQIAAFYQKIAVFDGAIIALSIILLGSLLSFIPGHHIPKLSFLLLVCPAWVLLLISMGACWLHISSCHGAIHAMHEQFAALTTEHNAVRMSAIATKLTLLPLPPLQQLAAEAKELQKEQARVAEESQAAMKKVADLAKDRSTRVLHVAHLSMLVGIVLLCIYAIKTLLSI
jgi:hypothetical protein